MNFAAARDFEVFAEDISRDDLEALRRQLAKAANQRMVRLENTASPVTGEKYTFGAYDIAKEYLEKQGRNRFAETKKQLTKSDYQLKKEISEIQNFLRSKSSTVGGMHQIEKKRIQQFKDKGISAASNKDFYDFLNSKSYEKLNEAWNSDDIIDIYDRGYREGLSASEIQKQFDDFMYSNTKKTKKNLIKAINAKVLKKKKSRKK